MTEQEKREKAIEEMAKKYADEIAPIKYKAVMGRRAYAYYVANKFYDAGYRKDPLELYLIQNDLVESVWDKAQELVCDRLEKEIRKTENKECKHRLLSISCWFRGMKVWQVRFEEREIDK